MSQVDGDMNLYRSGVKEVFTDFLSLLCGDLIRSRHLLKLLVKRDLNARYRRAYLGYAWAVLEPLLLAVVYTFIFTILVGSTDPLYPVKIVIGVIGWTMFARSLTTSTKSLSSSINLFQFARVPKTVFATSGTLTNAVLALISLSSLIPFYFINDLPITASLLTGPHLAAGPFFYWMGHRTALSTHCLQSTRCSQSDQFLGSGRILSLTGNVDL